MNYVSKDMFVYSNMNMLLIKIVTTYYEQEYLAQLFTQLCLIKNLWNQNIS